MRRSSPYFKEIEGAQANPSSDAYGHRYLQHTGSNRVRRFGDSICTTTVQSESLNVTEWTPVSIAPPL